MTEEQTEYQARACHSCSRPEIGEACTLPRKDVDTCLGSPSRPFWRQKTAWTENQELKADQAAEFVRKAWATEAQKGESAEAQKGESAKDYNREQEGMPCDFCRHHINAEPEYCVECGPENSNYDGYEFEVEENAPPCIGCAFEAQEECVPVCSVCNARDRYENGHPAETPIFNIEDEQKPEPNPEDYGQACRPNDAADALAYGLAGMDFARSAWAEDRAPKNTALENKPKPSLIPFDICMEFDEPAYQEGLIKYYRESWRKGFPISEMYDAAVRHLEKFFYHRQDYDPDAAKLGIKKHHLAGARFSIACMLQTLRDHPERDDREELFGKKETEDDRRVG